MNVLIVTNDLYPYVNANSSIAYTVAKTLQKNHNCNVAVLGFDRRKPNNDTYDAENNLKIFKIRSVCNYYKILSKYKNKYSKLFHLLIDIKTLRFCYNCFYNNDIALSTEYKHAIKAVLKKENFDCIIAFSAPTATLKALNSLKNTPPIISYKLDPWSNHYFLKNNLEEMKLEEKSDEKAAAIILTKPIFIEYQKDKAPKILQKTYSLNFPCLNAVPYDKKFDKNEIFKDDEINCVFVGNLYAGIRRADYAVEIFSMLAENKINFHIFGGQYGKCLDEKKLPKNVFYHGYVAEKKAEQYAQSADVLVNIGNAISNQMPSKILKYISFGKPIVNFVKIDDCPTLEYTSKYPIALNIAESIPVKDNISDLLDFCCKNKDIQISCKDIEKLYFDCTPEYVVSKLYSIMKKIIK